MPGKRSPAKPAGAVKREPGATGLADKLAKLGITRDEDLVLHLPLRYEDHTQLVAARRRCKAGDTAQAEGIVVNTDIQYRPRRQLVCLLADETPRDGARAQLVLRFFSFYPSQQKALAPGKRVRVFGDVRDGYFGLEIVHPQFKVVAAGTPLPDRLTPVYPTTAGLGQETLRKVIARAIVADPSRPAETLPEEFVRRRKLWKFDDAVRFLHAPPPRLARAHAACARRAHASGVDAAQVRRAARAAALAEGASQGARVAARAGPDRHRRADARSCSNASAFKLTRAQETRLARDQRTT